LSSLKQKEIDISKEQNLQSYEKEKFDWVEPISGSLSISKTHNKSISEEKTKAFAISISQPIFKSGGIYFAIKYAHENNYYNTLALKLQEKTLIASAYTTLLNIKKIEQNVALQEYQLKNAQIDVQRKSEQYHSGLIDSSYLDNAILKESSIATAISNLKISLIDLKKAFYNLSDLEPSDELLPDFMLMSEDEFLSSNLDAKIANSYLKKSDYVQKIRWASYMPTLRFNASYNNVEIDTATTNQNEYYSYGLTLSMPLIDMARDNVLELARLENLKASVTHQQKLLEAQNEYDATKQKLQIIDNKIEFIQSDIKRYASLVQSTDEKLQIGEVTIHDSQTMQNSMHSKELELGLLSIEKQIELLNLYKKLDD
jgi:outer membrane protein TolC